MRERNHAFDLLCGLCIIRMVCLHVMDRCGHGDDAWWQTVMDWTFFFMSFFFFKAGYFNKSLSGDSLAYCRDKARRLLVPYLCCGLIGDAVYLAFLPFLVARFHHPVEPLSWDMLWTRSSFVGNIPCWFLFSFFSAYVAAHFIEKARHLHWAVLAFPFVSYWLYTLGNPLWMSLDNVFAGLYFFFLGRAWHRLMDVMGRRLTIGVSVLLLVLFAAGNVCWHGEYTMSYNTFEGHPLPTMLNITAALCGLAGLLIAAGTPRVPVVNYIGQHSMVYFISHYPMIYFYKFTHLCFGRSIWGRYDDALILLPAVFCICSWLVPYVESVPWLSGRWPKGGAAGKAA